MLVENYVSMPFEVEVLRFKNNIKEVLAFIKSKTRLCSLRNIDFIGKAVKDIKENDYICFNLRDKILYLLSEEVFNASYKSKSGFIDYLSIFQPLDIEDFSRTTDTPSDFVIYQRHHNNNAFYRRILESDKKNILDYSLFVYTEPLAINHYTYPLEDKNIDTIEFLIKVFSEVYFIENIYITPLFLHTTKVKFSEFTKGLISKKINLNDPVGKIDENEADILEFSCLDTTSISFI